MIDIILSVLQQGIAFALVICVLVLFHELGHFTLAKLNGIVVHEFAIGMGPKLISHQGKETLYSIRAFPIGGYVNMLGESETSEDPNSFCEKKPLQRFSVLIAGPAMNFVLAFFIFFVLFLQVGVPTNVIDKVISDMPAATAGIEVGDEIVRIDQVKINTWLDVISEVGRQDEEPFIVEVLRNGEIEKITVSAVESEYDRRIIGIENRIDYSVTGAMRYGAFQVKYTTTMIFDFLVQLFQGKASSDEVVGPVGIVSAVGQASKAGILSVLWLAGGLSVNLGIINLLPFPALDGGRILFVIYELIFKRPIDREKENNLHFVGFVILIGLMVFLVFKDVGTLMK